MAAPVSRILDVIGALLRSHGVPRLLPLLVPGDIVDFGGQENADRDAVDDDQVSVATVVQWLVVVAVDVVRYYIAQLDHHWKWLLK